MTGGAGRRRYQQFLLWLEGKEAIYRAADILCFLGAGILAFLLRFEFRLESDDIPELVSALVTWAALKSVVFRLMKLDRGLWRFVSVYDVLQIAIGNLIGSAASAVVIFSLWGASFSRAVYLLDFVLCLLANTGLRISLRIAADLVSGARETPDRKRILIYGAGAAGLTLLREARSNPALGYSVCGFIDDHAPKRGARIHGVTVLGSGAELAKIAAQTKVQEAVVAIPSADGHQMTRIVRACHDAGLRCRTLPAISELIGVNALGSRVRDVAVEDLLGRSPVRLDTQQIAEVHNGRVILVTGAAGSIGSELCRQLARFRPRAIVGMDSSENGMFHLDLEMRGAPQTAPFHALIGNIRDERRLEEVFETYRPSIVYHAAAYKHVPLMELHVAEAVQNNVIATEKLARTAGRYGATDFVMISSDKAVRPSSVMGATKRAAELLVRAMPFEGTRFNSVRFGNVLGSNGSVVPLFKSQIAAGGPVTVTHPEMKRFFMTISEAVQLVLQASSMGAGREIFVLDMGEPVRILDLATNLILLSGLRPGQDIRIEFTGIRPGEKLYEELAGADESTQPTRHEKIKIFTGTGPEYDEVQRWMRLARAYCQEGATEQLVSHLQWMVSGLALPAPYERFDPALVRVVG